MVEEMADYLVACLVAEMVKLRAVRKDAMRGLMRVATVLSREEKWVDNWEEELEKMMARKLAVR